MYNKISQIHHDMGPLLFIQKTRDIHSQYRVLAKKLLLLCYVLDWTPCRNREPNPSYPVGYGDQYSQHTLCKAQRSVLQNVLNPRISHKTYLTMHGLCTNI